MDHVDGHRYFEGLAVAHVLGGLDDSEGRVFRAHLLECSSCRARVGELRAIAHDLADVERDERRVRAAQAIDTKRREAEEEVDESIEPVPSARSSRITVVVGLVMILGLSLWNFTLRGALELQQADNGVLVRSGVIGEFGTAWDETREITGVDGSIKERDGEFVLILDGLDGNQVYGVYIKTESGAVARSERLPMAQDGRVSVLFALDEDAQRVTVTNPTDVDGKVGLPGESQGGAVIFEATRPVG